MFRGETEGLQWKPPDRQRFADLEEDGIQQAISKEGVGGEGEMGTVLLHSTERPDHGGSGALACLLDLWPGHQFKTALRSRH